jgi:aquaporin Z
MKKYLVEFIGTFFLVLTVGMSVIDPGAAACAAGHRLGFDDHGLCGRTCFGRTLQSRRHARRVAARPLPDSADVLPYWISQIAGALAASCARALSQGQSHRDTAGNKCSTRLIAEFVGTFALAYVVLNVATAKATAGNSNYGLAIGFTVMVMAFALGGISGGAFNPAVATGITVMHMEKAANLWIYLAGDFAGGALAAAIFKFINPEDK